MGKCKKCGKTDDLFENGLCAKCGIEERDEQIDKSSDSAMLAISPDALRKQQDDKLCVDCKAPLLEMQKVKLVINGVVDTISRKIRFCSSCGMLHDENGIGLVAISIGDGNIYKNARQSFVECTIRK